MTTQTVNPGLKEYELIYILRPTVDNGEAERVNAKVSEIVESFGGKLTKLDNWGRRKLAYPMKKFTRGVFVYAKYLGAGGVVAEVERNLRITDSVLRQQTVLLRKDVQGDVEVDPEELKFAPVEDVEPEQELNLEQRLGLAPVPRAPREGDAEESAQPQAVEAEAPSAPAEAAPEAAQAQASTPETPATAEAPAQEGSES